MMMLADFKMRKYIFGGVFLICVGAALFWYTQETGSTGLRYSDTEVGFGTIVTEPNNESSVLTIFDTLSASPEETALVYEEERNPETGRIRWSRYWLPFSPEEERLYGSWQRPEGPLRVGIQAGHAELENVPEELEGLKASSGAFGGGVSEADTVLAIAEIVKETLEENGVIVDLIPATVPSDYVADAFVSIHADGSTSGSVSGFKIAGPQRDFSGRSNNLADRLYDSYGAATGLREDPSITRRMSGYYAFNWRRYDHALHPMTPAAIVETGFMTNDTDRALLVNQPEIPAAGIANGILDFLGLPH